MPKLIEGFQAHNDRVLAGKCPMCAEVVLSKDFTDTLSVKEFTISGTCQKCQDWLFAPHPEDEGC